MELNEELEIDIKDLLYRILVKWKRLLLFMVILGILMGIFGGVKSYQDVMEAEQALASQVANGGPQEGEEWVIVPAFEPVSAKYIIIGLFLGACIQAVIVGIPYIMTSRVRYRDDIPNALGIALLGFLPHYDKYSKGGRIDQMLNRLFWKQEFRFSESERLDMICTEIQIAVARKDMKRICLMSSSGQEADLMKTLEARLKEDAEVTVLPDPMINSPEGLKSVADSDGVVLIEGIDVSYYEDILKEKEYCDRFQIPIIGCVVVG